MSKIKESFRPVKTLKYIIMGILLCAVVGGAGYYFGTRGAEEETAELSAVVLQNQMTEMNEMVSVTYAYTNMAKYESSKEFYGMKLPLTTNGFILTYDGIIKAGVDLKQASVELNGTEVQILLPEAAILSHEIDEDSVEIYDETTSIFNPFTVEDYTGFYRDQKEEMEKEARNKGLLEEATTQAEENLRMLMEASLPEGYTVTIQTAELT